VDIKEPSPETSPVQDTVIPTFVLMDLVLSNFKYLVSFVVVGE